MRGVRIEDLSSVDISWKMLTLDRPDQKVDGEIFSRWWVEVEAGVQAGAAGQAEDGHQEGGGSGSGQERGS